MTKGSLRGALGGCGLCCCCFCGVLEKNTKWKVAKQAWLVIAAMTWGTTTKPESQKRSAVVNVPRLWRGYKVDYALTAKLTKGTKMQRTIMCAYT